MDGFFFDNDQFEPLELSDDVNDGNSVDFSANKFQEEKTEEKDYSGYKINYDKQTTEHYRIYRKLKICPISGNEVEDRFAFKYYNQWDPYTGEVGDPDPHGPLCFDPDQLIKYFHFNRLNKLWVEQKDEGADGGLYEGLYDDGVGAGKQFYVASRGYHPEWYQFRLPIPDCYLTKDHNTQVVTFGPELTNEQIAIIEQKAKLKGNSYRRAFNSYRPSIIDMKNLYDTAVSKTPHLDFDTSALSSSELAEQRAKANRIAVDKLKKMKG